MNKDFTSPDAPAFLPFNGIRYNLERLHDPAKVIAPPYDVISPAQRELLYAASPHNIAHIDLGKDQPGDDDANNRYTRAADMFRQWQNGGVLVKDDQPAFYVYDQQYEIDGMHYTRRALFSAMRLEPFGKRVLPHEETMPGPRKDRLKLLEACPVNLSPIFGLYRDADSAISGAIAEETPSSPLMSFIDYAGIKQTLWKIDEPQAVESIKSALGESVVYIADGHHRYETAIAYAEKHPSHSAGYIMIACVALSDPGLVVLPTHRVIGGLQNFDMQRVLSVLSEYFEITRFNGSSDLLPAMQGKRHALGLYAGGHGNLLVLKDPSIADRNPAERSIPWKRLDVSILGWLVLHTALGLANDDLSNPERIAYVKDSDEAAQLVDKGERQMACLLNPTLVEELEAVAQAGERMPPKSTYFYPKLLTGLVMRELEKF